MASFEPATHAQDVPAPRRSLAARLGITSVPRAELVRRYTQRGSQFVQIMGVDVHCVDEGAGERS
jgi:hypothetical protein